MESDNNNNDKKRPAPKEEALDGESDTKRAKLDSDSITTDSEEDDYDCLVTDSNAESDSDSERSDEEEKATTKPLPERFVFIVDRIISEVEDVMKTPTTEHMEKRRDRAMQMLGAEISEIVRLDCYQGHCLMKELGDEMFLRVPTEKRRARALARIRQFVVKAIRDCDEVPIAQ